jgi:hypothetical protein
MHKISIKAIRFVLELQGHIIVIASQLHGRKTNFNSTMKLMFYDNTVLSLGTRSHLDIHAFYIKKNICSVDNLSAPNST